MNALASSLTPFISSNEPFLIKHLLWRVEAKGVFKQQMKTNRGRGGSLCSPCEKNCLTFQIANIVLSNKFLGSC